MTAWSHGRFFLSNDKFQNNTGAVKSISNYYGQLDFRNSHLRRLASIFGRILVLPLLVSIPIVSCNREGAFSTLPFSLAVAFAKEQF